MERSIGNKLGTFFLVKTKGKSENTIVFTYIRKIQKKLIKVITYGEKVKGDIRWPRRGRK